MPWIKRNLPFVIGIAIAVGLLGFGVFYLLDNLSAADRAREELSSENTKWNDLVERKPAAPNDENIKAAHAQQEQLAKFRESTRPLFAVQPLPAGLDDAAFKNLLDRTVDSLEKLAERNSVRLPKPTEGKFAFTFEPQKKQLEFSSKTLVPLTVQLMDVSDLCSVLFSAKIHALESIRRTTVGTNDVNPPSNYMTKKVSTNSITGAAIYPYELTFNCFSAELAGVLSGLINAGPVYVVKSINVERGSTDLSAAGSATAAPAFNPMAARYGLPSGLAGRYGMGAAPSAPKPSEGLLDDKPLRVTLNIDVVKLPPAPPTPAAPGKKG